MVVYLDGCAILLEINNIIDMFHLIELIIVIFTLSIIIVVIKAIIKSHYRMHLLITKLDPVKFIEETDKEIKKISNIKYNIINKGLLKNNLKYIESLKIQKSIGLRVQGNFNEAQTLKSEIDMTKFDETLRKFLELDNINTIYPFIKNEEAIRIFLENEQQINEWLKIKRFKTQMMGSIAIYNFHIGNYKESKRLIKEMQKNKIDKLTYIETEYLLALIDIKEGREDEGRKRFSALLDPTKKIYLHDAITKQLES